MSRRITLLSVLITLAISMSGLVGCSESNENLQSTRTEVDTERIVAMETTQLRKMTSEDIARFKNQESFSWSDFSAYEGEDIGSGLFVFKYNLVDGGYLLVSGPSLEQEPQKIVYYYSDGEEDLIK